MGLLRWLKGAGAGGMGPVPAHPRVGLGNSAASAETTAADVRRELGPPSDGWDDGVECNLQYKAEFGSIEFSCDTELHGADRAFLRYIHFDRDAKPAAG